MSNLIPYVEGNGSWSLPDTMMIGIFEKMQDHGLDKVVFVNGTVEDRAQWLNFVKTKTNLVHVIGNEEGVELVAWINNFGKNYAFGHFCFFPEAWGKNTIKLGKQSLDHWFGLNLEGKPVLDVILGQLPTSNEYAVKYIKKIGMTILGSVPNIRYSGLNEATGATFAYITREDFYGRQT
jgi:hypothetical protein